MYLANISDSDREMKDVEADRENGTNGEDRKGIDQRMHDLELAN